MSAAGYLINKRFAYDPELESDILSILNDFDTSCQFHKTLAEYQPSPLIELPHLAKNIGIEKLLIKDEGQRFGTSAVKILGASYATHLAVAGNSALKGVCSATDGNHGRALAWSAKQKGIQAVIFVPHHTAKSRINFIEEEGASVIISKGDYDEAVNEAREFSQQKNFTLIQDTSWTGYEHTPANITAGYYTQLHEICNQTGEPPLREIDILFIQAGVGSWPSAVVHFIRQKLKNNRVKIVCVEPYESDAIYESVKLQSLAPTRKSQQTIMAGLNCGTPSKLAFEILRKGVDAFLIISDQYAIDAIKYLNAPLPGDAYIASGESGSAGLAGLLAVLNNNVLAELKKYLEITKHSRVLLFNTENVTDPELFYQLINS
jgi:diaminopropionate ammonia-lyase